MADKVDSGFFKFNVLVEVALLDYDEDEAKKNLNIKNTEAPERKRKREAKAQAAPKKDEKKQKRTLVPRERVDAELPAALRAKLEELGGRGFRVVMEKLVKKTDTEANNDRLSLPSTWLIPSEWDDLLTQDEKKDLAANKIVNVEVEEPGNAELRSVELKYWKMTTTKVLNLYGGWNPICASHDLAEDNFIQLWGYRLHHNNKLGFAVVKLGLKPAPVVTYTYE